MRWGLAALPVPYITAMIHPENARSIQVARRLGFEPAREDVLLGDPVIVYAAERNGWAGRCRHFDRRTAAAEDLARAGGRDAPIEIVAYDPAWPAAFEAERKRLAPLLSGVEVHHFGSTAVPGLAAKPVIDMIALVDDLEGKKMKVHVPKPKRTFLEMDELAALLDAAGEQDISPAQPAAPIELGLSAAMVAQLFAQGRSPKQIAAQLGLAKSTVSHHLKRLQLDVGRGYVGRRVVVEILGRGGPRASELCDIKIGHVRLHDPAGARFQIPDSKTEKGIREVQMSPDLVEVVVEHIDRLRRLGLPTGPDAYLVPNLKGGRMSYGRVEQLVRDAAQLASEKLVARGLPPLPHVTPHTLRRTYISIALLAYDWDVKYVMDQVGHADSKVTLDIYAQMQRRANRDHGAKFDRLVRDARTLLHRRAETHSEPPMWTAMGTAQPIVGSRTPSRARGGRVKTRRFAGDSPMEPTGIEPVTSCLQSRRSPS